MMTHGEATYVVRVGSEVTLSRVGSTPGAEETGIGKKGRFCL
jgi:hypothetical protein